jgi:hypothetical protein
VGYSIDCELLVNLMEFSFHERNPIYDFRPRTQRNRHLFSLTTTCAAVKKLMHVEGQ